MKQLIRWLLTGSRKQRPIYRVAEYYSRRMSKTLNARDNKESNNYIKIDLYEHYRTNA